MIYLGCSQWHYELWKGTLYPEGVKPTEFLHYYSQRFGCVELNSTYYEIPDSRTILSWKSKVGSSFRFCPKVPKLISHERYLNNVEQPTDDFIDSVKLFGENLGISFLQLAPSMFTTNIPLIEKFLQHVGGRIKISTEIRPDWLARPHLLTKCLQILKKYNTGVVILDGTDTVEYLNSIRLTNSSAFIRFLSYNHQTDFARINDWVNLIKLWQDKGIKEVYFILHFTDGFFESPTIKYTLEKFEKELGLNTDDLKQAKLF